MDIRVARQPFLAVFLFTLANGLGALPALIAAQRFFAASAIALRAATLSLCFRSTTGADGVLHIDVPTGFPETEIEGRLVMNPVSGESSNHEASGTSWPEGFFEATAGRWQGELERGEQGKFDQRDWPE